MERVPLIRRLVEPRQLTLSGWVSLQQCLLKGVIDICELDGPLPEQLPTRATLVGRFHHRVMELAASSQSDASLEEAIEAEIALVQSEAAKWPHLRRAGSVSGWDEVNASAALALRTASWRKADNTAALRLVEHTLRSRDGLLIGKPDRYTIVDRSAFLKEYKSGAIRDDAGALKAAYLDQLSFYTVLIFDNYDVDSVMGAVESLSGDVLTNVFDREDAVEFAERILSFVKEANVKVRAAETASEIASASADACTYCAAQSVCQRFKAEQDRLGLEGEQYLCEGIAVGLRTGDGGRVSQVTFADELRSSPLTIAIPSTEAAFVKLNMKYQLLNLRRRGTGFEWGYTSRIFCCD